VSAKLPHSSLGALSAWAAQLRRIAPAHRRLREDTGRFAAALLGQLLPRSCLLCEAACGDAPLCDPCQAFLPGARRARCRCCARPWAASPHCASCRDAPPAFTRTIAAADYVPPFDRAITALKFGGSTGLAPALGALLADACRADGEDALAQIDRIVPVPLSAARLAERGFNQAHLVAAALVRRARPARARLAPGLLSRQRDTLPQSSLQSVARHANLDHGFVAHPDVAELRIAVVDDVMTTGATLEAAAIALRGAGARDVINLVVARTA
jgi:ComF family protein